MSDPTESERSNAASDVVRARPEGEVSVTERPDGDVPSSAFAVEDSRPSGRGVESAHVPGAAPWEFGSWGSAQKVTDLEQTRGVAEPSPAAPQHKLGVWRATAICGNDITSSVLYVVALCTAVSGVYAPIALAMVGLVLYLFRKIYAEVGSALPLNGGAYNVLLNTSTKAKASVAACLTLLSYVATAVISSNEALHYAHQIVPSVPIMAGTVALLGLFALLNIIGITESALVALGIFVLHIATLAVLTATSAYSVYADGFAILINNWHMPTAMGVGKSLFIGFAAGLLGISGFESSANFIEEQKPGVFQKTLRNMWGLVFVFNPLICLLALGMLPVGQFGDYKTALLAEMGNRSAGSWLGQWVGIDAVLVLSGAVLTSYVGVTGLVRRMALDRIMPQALLRENRWRQTPHFIIVAFFLLCCSILFITNGKVETLAGVYTISFLGVMMLFAVGNRLLAMKRARLPRTDHASWPAVIFAMLAVGAGLVGNIMGSLENASIFLMYFAVALTVVGVMLYRVKILQGLLFAGQAIQEQVRAINEHIARWTTLKIGEINSQSIIFFTRGDGPANLRRAIEYVLHNEATQNLIVVHVYSDEQQIPPQLAHQLSTFGGLFPEIRISFVAVRGRFGPALIERLSVRLNVPRNYMFIGCPGDSFPHNLGDLGGVRLIV